MLGLGLRAAQEAQETNGDAHMDVPPLVKLIVCTISDDSPVPSRLAEPRGHGEGRFGLGPNESRPLGLRVEVTWNVGLMIIERLLELKRKDRVMSPHCL